MTIPGRRRPLRPKCSHAQPYRSDLGQRPDASKAAYRSRRSRFGSCRKISQFVLMDYLSILSSSPIDLGRAMRSFFGGFADVHTSVLMHLPFTECNVRTSVEPLVARRRAGHSKVVRSSLGHPAVAMQNDWHDETHLSRVSGAPWGRDCKAKSSLFP
jgi:hypothetical protein